MQAVPAVFIKPHYDDVALACGGTAADFAQRALRPRIVTVFASEIVEPMVTSAPATTSQGMSWAVP